ncbi:hypothetical protein [Streptomyces iconiensis]|uniref:Uncharacterized protein n=1 Tax=Streptomyces iconiensis TaxID=1384038 RepID=A0ABT7A5Y1_9ACTN|nr:hypothetical protein [Streptomyces iconiensis]MDJ1136758.1 hypothetical protein [Streptomyces iconiensis]
MRLLISRWGGWGALAAGAVLCAIGWYGVSGERFAERQLPYLASCTVPGAALIVAGAVLLAAYGIEGPLAREPLPPGPRGGEADEPRHATAHGGQQGAVTDHLGLTADGSGTHAEPGPLVAVPAGTLAHAAGCPLVDGKPEAAPVTAETVRERGLRPCPICEPTLPLPPQQDAEA